MTQVSTTAVMDWLNGTLQPERFRDYCPNGLQVQGNDTVSHIVLGVTASQALLERAVALQAQAVLVHHGWFWKNEDPCIRGMKRRRLALALQHGLNVLAYHLPLDAHPELGNNAQLARVLGFVPELDANGVPRRCGPDDLVWLGSPPSGIDTLGKLARHVGHTLNRPPQVIGDDHRAVQRIAWCTGAAQGMIDAAVAAGADAYLTGEISEPTVHTAREMDVGFIGAGHHATERYGVQALGAALADALGVQVTFVDIDNPV
ncbi:MAG: Nif3-like dinuclear metal center hexameric protein [Burkholderiaceae bacterium]